MLQTAVAPPLSRPQTTQLPRVPHISVIIPAYNVARFIAETLRSVFVQTFDNYEVIVINDGSSDTVELERVLAPYRERIIYLVQSNQGAGPARNVGIQHAQADLIAFLDGDDIWQPNFLASQIAFLQEHNYDLVYCDAYLFGASEQEGQTYMQEVPSVGTPDFTSLLDLRCHVITSGSVMRKQAVVAAGMFEWKNYCGQDRNLWLRMAHRGARFGYQKEVLLKYRVRSDGLSGNSQQRLQRAIDGYHRIAAQIALNDEEQAIMSRHLVELETEMAIERGKSALLSEDFATAANEFTQANGVRHSLRLHAVIWLVRWTPQLLLKIYRARRQEAIACASVAQPVASDTANR